MNLKSVLSTLACTAALNGCASIDTPSYSPNYQAIDALKTVDLGKAAVYPVLPIDPKAAVNHISLRGTHLEVPGGTFAGYLQQAITSDLIEAGIYDPRADTKLALQLLENDINIAGLINGSGTLAVNLKIIQRGRIVLNKQYAAQTQFDSSLAGTTAIPQGQNAYPHLVKTLLATIYRDHQFIQVLQQGQ